MNGMGCGCGLPSAKFSRVTGSGWCWQHLLISSWSWLNWFFWLSSCTYTCSGSPTCTTCTSTKCTSLRPLVKGVGLEDWESCVRGSGETDRDDATLLAGWVGLRGEEEGREEGRRLLLEDDWLSPASLIGGGASGTSSPALVCSSRLDGQSLVV